MSETRLTHFELPPQWSTMREATRLERTTGARIIHLEKGDFASPEFKPPQEAVEAVTASLREGFVRYSPGPGTWPLREALAQEMTRRGRPTAAEEIIVTPGAKFGITASFLLFLDEGDEVIMPNPGYPPDEFWARYLRATIQYVGFRDSRHVDTDQLEDLITPRTRLVVLNTPQRPNGQLIENTAEIAAVLERHPQVTVISDEIFSQVVYPPYHHVSLASYPSLRDRTVVIDTFSNENTVFLITANSSPIPSAYWQESTPEVPWGRLALDGQRHLPNLASSVRTGRRHGLPAKHRPPALPSPASFQTSNGSRPYPAQQESLETSRSKVKADSRNPSAMVR